jgi:beta-glucosidase-like glycosyl hydrolase
MTRPLLTVHRRQVNGIPSCANTFLLNDIARAQWGFDGYITRWVCEG